MQPADTGAAFQKPIPARAGVGLKPEHYQDILSSDPDLGFFEVHAENYMGAGGPPHRYLSAIAERYGVSLHGVGLSIGGANPLDKEHLQRLKGVVARYNPALFSEHLAWSTHEGVYYNDLLPLPYSQETLARVCDHIDEVQDVIGRRMLLENPSTYVRFEQSSYDEVSYLGEIAKRTGCGLLLDVNNVYVSATNHGFDPVAYLDTFPHEHVGEIHLGGHAEDTDGLGRPLLIDAHDREVVDPVWALYRQTLAIGGAKPTLIEWDNDVPDFTTLYAEAQRADAALSAVAGAHHVAAE